MKNTNKFLTAVIAATIALCASAQISAMYGEAAQYTKNIIIRLEKQLKQLTDPKLYSPMTLRSREHQEKIREIESEIAERIEQYNEYMRMMGR